MEFGDAAMIAKAKGTGSPDFVRELYKKAYEIEKEAVLKMPKGSEIPVPRTSLIRGAAALAYHAGLFQEAEKMIALCLAEDPPESEVEKLNDIKKRMEEEKPAVKSTNGHLQIKGVLKQANSLENEITVHEMGKQKLYSILVPAKQLSDIVKKYWQDEVNIEASSTPNGVFVLEKISKAA